MLVLASPCGLAGSFFPSALRLWCWLEKALMPQPLGTRLRPGGTGLLAGADPEVMRRPRIDVQFRRDVGTLQLPVHHQTMFRSADRIVAAVCQKDWRRLLRNAQARREFIFFLVLEVARIDPDGEVRPAAD